MLQHIATGRSFSHSAAFSKGSHCCRKAFDEMRATQKYVVIIVLGSDLGAGSSSKLKDGRDGDLESQAEVLLYRLKQQDAVKGCKEDS